MKTLAFATAVTLVLGWNSFAPAALIDYWTFNGTGNDAGTNGLNVTLLNGATYAAGVFGQALSLDGVDDYANRASSAPFTSDGTFTISVWANQIDASPVSQRYIGWGASGSRAFLGPFAGASGRITAGISGATITFTNAAAMPLQNTWQNWIFVRSGTSGSLYLNGTLVESQTLAVGGAISATNELHIGQQFGPGAEYFHGRLDDLAIWNEALTQSQINNVVNLGAGLYAGVPEPSTFALLCLGVVGLAVRSRRRTA